MKLFSKEKGIIFSILNAVLVIWVITATVVAVSNITPLVIKDYEYTYEEYKMIYCDSEYETEEECNNNFNSYKLDKKVYNVDYKRNVVTAVFNIVLVSGVLFVLNKERKVK